MPATRHPSHKANLYLRSTGVTTPLPLPPSPGIGLKPQHYRALLEHASVENLASQGGSDFCPGWVEVHPQNYFGAGGPPHRWLSAVREVMSVSFHSVGLSIGSAEGLNTGELEKLSRLCQRYEPACVSDHLSWSGTADNRFPDLLPLPYTRDCLNHFADQVSRAQDALGRSILIENPSRYLAFAFDEFEEAEFLHALCRKAGCGLLFDINNVEVSAANLGLDPFAMVDAIDASLVGEIHLAGHAIEQTEDGPLLIDDHGSAISELTWHLFERFFARAGPRPVLVEWDTNVPGYKVLIREARKAATIMANPGVADAA